MAQTHLDTTGNTHHDLTLAAIEANFTDLYTNPPSGSTPSLTSVTTSGLTTAQSLKLDTGTKTATASAGAATLNKSSGVITTEALTTAAGSTYTLTLTDSQIAAGDLAVVSVDANGSTGTPHVNSVKTTSNTLTVVIANIHATVAFNAALKVTFAIIKA
jgi:hypothetical protein